MNYVEGIKIGGATAAQIPCIKGSGVPTTKTAGAVGCLYMDIDTSNIYKCTTVKDGVYTWVEVGGDYYCTTREEIERTYDENGELVDVDSKYIYALYNAYADSDAYPNVTRKQVEVETPDGTFTNYYYEITAGEYEKGAYVTQYGNDPPIKKTKYLILSGIHGRERKTALSTFRFIRDVIEGRNVPNEFRQGTIISVFPVGTPSAFNSFARLSDGGVDINRNFDCRWERHAVYNKDGSFNRYTDQYGSSEGSEAETQAIVKWLTDNKDADLFVDFHNNGGLHEKVLIIGLPDESTEVRATALRGVDRVIPYWRDVLKYPLVVEAEGLKPNGYSDGVKQRDVIFSYTATCGIGGLAFAYAQEKLGICSLALETASHYGNHSEYYDENGVPYKTYSAEAIAMGAEALGNILIEFYRNEVNTVDAEANKKLDEILGIIGKGFRAESGQITFEEDYTISGNTYKIPCSPGAKAFVFYASDSTMEDIRNTYGKKYTGSIVANFYATKAICNAANKDKTKFVVKHIANNMADISSALGNDSNGNPFWDLNPGSTTCGNDDGVWFKFNIIKAGTYNWTAYYWNE